MNNYIDFNARHVAALLLIEARKGIRPPVFRNVRAVHWVVPRMNHYGIPAGRYYKVVEE